MHKCFPKKLVDKIYFPLFEQLHILQISDKIKRHGTNSFLFLLNNSLGNMEPHCEFHFYYIIMSW